MRRISDLLTTTPVAARSAARRASSVERPDFAERQLALRWPVARELDELEAHEHRDRWRPARAHVVLESPDLRARRESRAPLADSVLRALARASDRGVAGPLSRQQNDPCALHTAAARAAGAHDPFERAALARVQLQAWETRTGHVLASDGPRSR